MSDFCFYFILDVLFHPFHRVGEVKRGAKCRVLVSFESCRWNFDLGRCQKEVRPPVNGKAKGESLSNVCATKIFIFALVTISLGLWDFTRVSTKIIFSLDYDVLSYRSKLVTR